MSRNRKGPAERRTLSFPLISIDLPNRLTLIPLTFENNFLESGKKSEN
jgi:hypothetical protein